MIARQDARSGARERSECGDLRVSYTSFTLKTSGGEQVDLTSPINRGTGTVVSVAN